MRIGEYMASKFIIISPYASKLPNNRPNPKNYPYWPEIVLGLLEEGFDVQQIGIDGEKIISSDISIFHKNLSFSDIGNLISNCFCWFSVDNFLQHFVQTLPDKKPGVVIWGKSDPLIFGYPDNLNILEDRKNLRHNQFDYWFNEPYDAEVFPCPKKVLDLFDERFLEGIE